MRLHLAVLRSAALAILGLSSATVCAQSFAIWDLGALVREAAQQHPSVLNAQSLSVAAQADVDYAQRQRYPELSLSSLSQSNSTSGALVVKQPLWAGGAIEAAEAVSHASAEVQRASTEEQALTISLRVIEAWQNYFLSAEKIAIVDQGITQLQDLVDMMQRRVDAKISPTVELELAKARVIQAQIGRASLVAERDLAIKRLQELVGQPVTIPRGADDAKSQWLTAIHRAVAMPSVGELELVARDQPTVRRVRLEALVAQAEIRQTEASSWPTVYLQYQHGINQAITNDKRVGLALEYTPGRGFSSRERIRGAMARAQARDINIQTAIRDARDSLNAKLQEMARTQALEQSWVPAVEASEKLLASYRRQFIAGRKSWQDVLSQQNDLTQGRQSMVDARIRWVSAWVELRLMMAAKSGGKLPGEDWQSLLQSPPKAGLSAVPAAREVQSVPLGAGSLQGQTLDISATREGAASVDTSTVQTPDRTVTHKPSESNLLQRGWLADDLFETTAVAEPVLSDAGRERVYTWLAQLKRSGQRFAEVHVVGHSDSLGEPSDVLARSKAMALRVVAALKDGGVNTERWQVEWVGASKPVDVRCGFEATPANRQCHGANRRVNVKLMPVTTSVRPVDERGNS